MVTRPWMPLYVADYLADTTHLSAAEHGAYLLLIMHYWQAGGLPGGDRKLARIARMSDKEWKEARETIAEFFSEGWRHERIEKELGEANEKYERRAKAGREGGIARSRRVANGKHEDSNATGIASDPSSNATAMPQALLNQPQPQSQIAAGAAIGPGPPSNDLDRVQAACCAALGVSAPADLVIGPMAEMFRKFGEQSVLEALRSEARRARKKPVKSWRLWAMIVDEALAGAEKLAPAAHSGGPSERLIDLDYAGVQMPEKNLLAAIERWRKSPASWLRNVWGPPPDESAIIRRFAAEQGIDIGKVEDAA